jgi:hypothetical protein
MGRHRLQFEEEHEALGHLQEEYGRVISDYEAARRDFESRLDSAEASRAAFESSVERRLVLIESQSVSRTELERDYPRKSGLQSNYLTKSELEAKYATKADLQSNYVGKAHLEANYATSSALESKFLAKSDAPLLEQRCASKAYVDEELKLLKRVVHRFVPIPAAPLNGIIHHLTLECGGNVHDRGVVAITADRPVSGHTGYAAKNIADLETNSYFYCHDAVNMWVCYDFKTMKVALTDYSIRSRYDHEENNLKSWVIEVSNDCENWTEADRRENRNELCAKDVVRTFAVSKPSTGRYVRLRQIGVNDQNNFATLTSGFELFGELIL